MVLRKRHRHQVRGCVNCAGDLCGVYLYAMHLYVCLEVYRCVSSVCLLSPPVLFKRAKLYELRTQFISMHAMLLFTLSSRPLSLSLSLLRLPAMQYLRFGHFVVHLHSFSSHHFSMHAHTTVSFHMSLPLC